MKTQTKLEVKLVEGTFTPADAADVLFTLIGDKIKFHNLQILSLQERFGETTKNSEKRVKELKDAKNKVKDLVIHARNEGCELGISGAIEITLLENDSL